ncbi:sensor domain-containing diguanylate cyclase [Halomonas jincaotanensis]|uniref:sensor domain-containing diguanylate cyclase n=1 Tax=Halomonas jincaotanensis TaxID=2810616 RepID=UPI0020231147|nr:sensor domain-containing diguanylate cyclase [Halomonas jincaotanensis]
MQTLADYRILDTPEESAFDDIVEVASLICEAPISVINFIDRDRQWFKSEKGLGVRETPLDISICAHAILQPGLFIIPDTTLDPRFANNPLVTGEPHLRFYAGALLESQDGYPLGTLCVLDYQPRELSERQRFALQALANQVMAHLELMQAHREQAELIRELETARHDLAKRAATDPLTGLLNRRAFEQRLNQEVALMQRGAPPAALMLIDLDLFKTVNDTLGHQAGDEVLVRFTELCREVFRQADVIGRWGGEEFVVMLPRSSVAEAHLAAERLHQILATTAMLDDISPPLYITASIGICSLTGSSNLDECLQKTDELLYQAKDQGRNRTVCEPQGTPPQH